MNTLELLEHEEAVMLPDREALDFLNFTNVEAINAAVSYVSHSGHLGSSATATQTIVVVNGPIG
jgi:hypothetical protein